MLVVRPLLIALWFAGIAATPASAADDTVQKMKLAQRVLQLTASAELVSEQITVIARDLPPAQREKVLAVARNLDLQEMMQGQAQLMVKHFTLDDLQLMHAAYSPPEMQRVLKKMGAYNQEAFALAQQTVMRAVLTVR